MEDTNKTPEQDVADNFARDLVEAIWGDGSDKKANNALKLFIELVKHDIRLPRQGEKQPQAEKDDRSAK